MPYDVLARHRLAYLFIYIWCTQSY